MAKRHNAPPLDTVNGDSDAQAFREAVRNVKPLGHAAPPAGLTPKPRARPRRVAALDLEEVMPLVADPGARAAASRDGDRGEFAAEPLAFKRPGVRIAVLRKLRRGLFPVDDEIDLHGLSQAAARDRLAHFLAGSSESGLRCVRVIHGKGYRSGARGPVLKEAVNHWLRRHHDVAAFCSARTIDGGTGAVYVLLRA